MDSAKNCLVECLGEFYGDFIEDVALVFDTDNVLDTVLLEYIADLLRVTSCYEDELDFVLGAFDQELEIFLADHVATTIFILKKQVLDASVRHAVARNVQHLGRLVDRLLEGSFCRDMCHKSDFFV